jgi:serine/threonine protein kinase
MSAVPLPVGALIASRYEVLEYLGSGGYGEVYRVRDHHLDATFALKLMRRFASTNVWAEGQILMRLRSQYILEVENADIDAGVPFLVTAFAANGSADGPMDPIGVPPERAVRWVRHACRGAARTHASRLLHRDIKPHNLFLTASGEAQLGDFGVAVLMDANGEAASFGTPVTRAPEVTAGGNTSVASDVYSLGATLYALLSGGYSNVLGDPPIRDVAPHVSLALAQRVHTAIAPDPADRYGSPAEFDAALGDLPVPRRAWRRTDEHAGHTACFRGEAPGKTDATVCLMPAGTRWEVVARHQPSGRRITAACRPPGPQSALPRNLRAAMADVP